MSVKLLLAQLVGPFYSFYWFCIFVIIFHFKYCRIHWKLFKLFHELYSIITVSHDYKSCSVWTFRFSHRFSLLICKWLLTFSFKNYDKKKLCKKFYASPASISFHSFSLEKKFTTKTIKLNLSCPFTALGVSYFLLYRSSDGKMSKISMNILKGLKCHAKQTFECW